MSSSDRLTNAYQSAESSKTVLSSTLSDAYHIRGSKAHKSSVAAVAASTSPIPAAVMHANLMAGAAGMPTALGSAPCITHLVESEQFEMPIVPEDCDDAPAESVVNRRDVSFADISRMRLEGCRARHTSLGGAASLRGSSASSPRCTSASPISLADRSRDHIGILSETSTKPASVAFRVPAWPSFIGLGRSIHARSGVSPTPTNALDTSVAILQHMAQDTAARVEAINNAHALADIGSISASISVTGVPPSLQSTHHLSARPHASSGEHDAKECAGPIFTRRGDSDGDRPISPFQTNAPRQGANTPGSSLALKSLSESELLVGQLRSSTYSQVSSYASATCPVSTGMVAQASWDLGRGSPPPSFDSVERFAHRQTTLKWEFCGSAQSAANTAVAGPTRFPVGAVTTKVARAHVVHQTQDTSVCNHDFQHVVPLGLKEVLRRNMRPVCEEDDEEGDAMLNDTFSMRVPLPLTPFDKVTPILSEDPCTLGVQEHHTCAGGALLTFSPYFCRTPSRVLTSPSAVAPTTTTGSLSACNAAVETGRSIHRVGSGGADATLTALSISGTGVPFQRWRFPSLGNPSTVLSPRKVSFGDDRKEEEAPRGAGRCPGVAAESAARIGGHGSDQVCTTLVSPSRQQPKTARPSSIHNGVESSSTCGVPSEAAIPHDEVAIAGLLHAVKSPVGAVPAVSSYNPRHLEASDAHGSSSPCGGGVGKRLIQPVVSAGSSSHAACDSSVHSDCSTMRKLEMVYIVYERLLRLQPPAKSVSAKCVKNLRMLALRSFKQSLTPLLSPNPPSMSVVLPTGQVSATAPVPTDSVSETTRLGGSSSPWMSSSSALGRSAGYYSFGKRVSLSHPNRQTLPHQFLGSASNVQVSSSQLGIATRDSSAIAGVVASLRRNGSGSPMTHSFAADTRLRTFDPSLLRCIEYRPLLQLTLFLQRTIYSICEAQVQGMREGHEKYTDAFGQYTLFSTPVVTGGAAATRVQSASVSITADSMCQLRFSPKLRSASLSPSPPNTVDDGRREGSTEAHQTQAQGFVAASAKPLLALSVDVAAATASSAAPVANSASVSSSSSGSTHVPSMDCVGFSSSSSSSPTSRRSNISCLSSKCIQEAQEKYVRKQGAAHTTLAPDSPGAAVDIFSLPEGHTSPEHRHHRNLTEAGRLTRHVHGVDGIEREVDNEALDLVVYVGMHLMGWLEVVSLLGRGSFGQVFLCKDLRICDGHFVHPKDITGEDYEYWNCSHTYLPFSSVDMVPAHSPLVAVKVVKSVPLLEQQSVLEAEMLVLIGAQTAPPVTDTGGKIDASATSTAAAAGEDRTGANAPPPEDRRCANIAKVLADGICYGHHCIVMERYGSNLYEYIAANDHRGLPMYQIRSVGAQLFSALTLVHECHIIHADIKPENVLLSLNVSRGTPSPKDASSHGTVSSRTPSGAAGNAKASTTAANTTTLQGNLQSKGSTGSADGSQRSFTPSTEPSWHQQRTDFPAQSCAAAVSLAGHSETTSWAPPDAGAQQLLGQQDRRHKSNTPPDVLSPATPVTSQKGMRLSDRRRNSASRAAAGEKVDLLASYPRPFQPLQHSPGVLTSAPSGVSLPSLGDGGDGGRSRSESMKHLLNASNEEFQGLHGALLVPRLHIRLIDFSSSCYDGGPFYQYIQSRYYRAPEVIIGAAYSAEIDLWSAGCVLAELLIGMPLLPGCNDHHQLSLIEEMLGPLPDFLVESGDSAQLFYARPEALHQCSTTGVPAPHSPFSEVSGAPLSTPPPPQEQQSRLFTLRTREDYLEVVGGEPLPYRRYFNFRTLQDLVRYCPLTVEERRMSSGLQPYVPANESSTIPPNATFLSSVRSDMMKQRFLLYDLLRRLLQTNPRCRPTAAEALGHPFFTSSPPYLKTFALE